MVKKCCFIILLSSFLIGCGHTQSSKVGLMSFGELEGKTIPDIGGMVLVNGEACGYQQRLSDAVRAALKQTDYDTLVDAQVISTTGLWVSSNCITVKGNALNSKTLTTSGGR
jgi:hypothetical protein